MTEAFVTAAELMGSVLGAPEYPFVLIDHPISSASRDALAERARAVAAEVVLHLTRADRRDGAPAGPQAAG